MYCRTSQSMCRLIGECSLTIGMYRRISSSKEAKLLVQQHVAHMDLSNVSRTSRNIPRKWNVQTGKLNYLYNSRHRLEYRHVYGDVRAMKRRCYGDIHRWIGDVQGASANNPLIFGNSSAFDRGLPPSIGNHRRTFDLSKYRIFAKHRRIVPNAPLTVTNASPNYRRTPPIIRLGTFMCDCKLTSCQYREQLRQIAIFFHRETPGAKSVK